MIIILITDFTVIHSHLQSSTVINGYLYLLIVIYSHPQSSTLDDSSLPPCHVIHTTPYILYILYIPYHTIQYHTIPSHPIPPHPSTIAIATRQPLTPHTSNKTTQTILQSSPPLFFRISTHVTIYFPGSSAVDHVLVREIVHLTQTIQSPKLVLLSTFCFFLLFFLVLLDWVSDGCTVLYVLDFGECGVGIGIGVWNWRVYNRIFLFIRILLFIDFAFSERKKERVR